MELYTRVCQDCNKTFITPNLKDRLCISCKKKHKRESQRVVAEECKAIEIVEEERPKPKVSIAEEQHVERVYNAIHKSRYYGYSEIVKLIEDRKNNTCVCCGEIVPEGRMVCPNCERRADDARKRNFT